MNSNIDGRILAKFFAAAAALAPTAATSVVEISQMAETPLKEICPPLPPDTSDGMASPPPPAMTPS